MSDPVWNPVVVDTALDSRSISFENPTGGRGAGGSAHGGRKGAPSRKVRAGERVVLADIAGPGVIRHIWMTFTMAAPERMRGLYLEVYYDGADEPSVSVPCLDFFGLPHGRRAPLTSALMAVNEGRGMNCYIPIPFRSNVRVEFANGGARSTTLYYQIDYTLQAVPADHGYLHATFRRENPTTMRRDFVIARGFHGPGRFLGCNVGVRIIDQAAWYGEGEVKVFRDGDTELPTICGTGLEDYVGSAWGLGAHCAPYGGAPIVVRPPNPAEAVAPPNPDFVGFYRWHVPDPIVFARELTVTIQQIGANAFRIGEEEQMKAYEQTNPPAGAGWNHDVPAPLLAWTLAERVDDYCATAYVVCTEPQAVPRVDIASALADIERRPYEVPVAGELISETLTGG